MKRDIKAGSIDQTIDIFIQDSASTTGAGLAGLVFNSAGLTCYYRKGALGTPTALTLVTQTVGGAHSDGGFVAVDGTNCPGQYRLDLSDTIVATAGAVTLYLKGATNMAPTLIELFAVGYDPLDGVRLGLTALPNAAAQAAGGLYTRGTGAGQINQAANGQIDVNSVAVGGATPETSAVIATSVVDLSLTGHTTAGTVGAAINNAGTKTAFLPSVTAGAAGGVAIVGSAMTLTTGERDSIADAHLDRTAGVETGLTPRQHMRVQAGVAAGNTTGMGTTTGTIKSFGVAGAKNRVVATIDADGNRTITTVDLT